MHFISRIANFFISRSYWQYFILFIIVLSLFTYLQLDPTFADPDSFYHAKMAEILAQKGAITEFPWLSATNLKYSFVDHHFLYHLILVPFVIFLPPLIGLKVATIIFASLAILFIFWFLRQLQVKGAFWYALFLLFINPFVFRLNLAKAQQLVLIFLFLIIYLFFRKQYLFLIFFSCLFVWLYGGWPLILLVALIYIIVSYFWLDRQKGWLFFKIGKIKSYWQNILLGFSAFLGIITGLFFNPYFPKNIGFYWQQSFQIAILNYQNLISVGGEWYPYPPFDLFLAAVPFFFLFVIALIFFVLYFKKQPMSSWFFLVLSILFFVLTIKSRRYVEYFIPLGLCFSAISLDVFFKTAGKKFKKHLPNSLIIFGPVLFFLALSPFFYRDLRLVKNSYQQGLSFTKFSEPMDWLKQHSNKGDIVFHSDWDEFPILFYHNDKDYYLVGLDPTFMYLYDKDLHQRWVEITTGRLSENLPQIIGEVFNAKYVFVDKNQNPIFDQNLENNFYFQKVFANEEANIYQLVD